ncbi:MAG: tyrosine-protein phosphatase [Hydrogenophaga sp.]|uniref:tyrosine-protein phosphatase n=1 Tax=Hydrogenophaga sp. TaxID=1904254 RepID=UPI001D5589E1|nr:tyrosine-protein phosphatase [Hydrogenophaga sp.]MBX3611085.1 tyrosine-protein phosphatase [Hydrogenophaga sp.]
MTTACTELAVSLEGASNFRDLGGHAGHDGLTVRRGLVYRSDHLGRLSSADLQRLTDLDVTHCVDLRGEAERRALPNRLPGVLVEHLGIEPTVLRRVRDRMASAHGLGRAEAVELMCETYRDFVRLHGAVFGQVLTRIAEQRAALVFHCTAGKDRTGMTAALLLGALGVHRDDVMADYLLTNRLYRRDARVEEPAPPEVLEVLWQVQPAFLHTAWRCIDEEFGGIDAYLAGPMGLSPALRQRLRDRLLAQD